MRWPLSASSKYEEGIAKCLEILSLLGTVIPTEITTDVHIHEVAQVKELLRGKSRQELLSLPMMLETQYLVSVSGSIRAHLRCITSCSHVAQRCSSYRQQCNLWTMLSPWRSLRGLCLTPYLSFVWWRCRWSTVFPTYPHLHLLATGRT